MKQIAYNTPEELLAATNKNRKSTSLLIKKLAKKKPKNLDDFVHHLHNEAFEDFSCLNCANCCKTIGPRLTHRDIDKLAKHLKIKPVAFTEQYVSVDEDGDYVFNAHPCPFLLPDNHCMVYENRPKACREYPHTNRPRFYQIIKLSAKNCETCPVVFRIFEELKKKFL
ncbi:MAG: zinc/iron-chelating domain-containing protein [Draconibacterium sp.]|nr:MAG: zinc/iron-chelating domain-containing protein [Draconibacterium sp.]